MQVFICKSDQELGRLAAERGARKIRQAIRERGTASIVLATGLSQRSTLEALVREPRLEWDKVRGFHLDEYVGLPPEHPASFRRYLRERFTDLVPLAGFTFIDGEADPKAECRRLARAIGKGGIDVAFIGIGENGHLAFNDPPANFTAGDPFQVVDLDEDCRRQQVGEGWFERLEDVPGRAISMSIKQIMKCRSLICACPEERKARAVQACLEGPISPYAPASILQRHEKAFIYLDRASASRLRSA